MTEPTTTESGVQGLIDRLREEGVRAGRETADQILTEARERAAHIVEQAKAEANAMLEEARADMEKERAAANESLRLAIRDSELRMAAELKASFSAHVRRLVSMEMQDKEFLRQVILAVAGLVSGDKVCSGQPAEVLLPGDLFVADERGAGLTELGKERLRHLVLGISGEMLREGVVLKPAPDAEGGIRLRMAGEDLEIDLSDRAISAFLRKFGPGCI